MNLKKHLSNDQGLSDLLNYAHLIDEGVIINKDGAFLVCYNSVALISILQVAVN